MRECYCFSISCNGEVLEPGISVLGKDLEDATKQALEGAREMVGVIFLHTESTVLDNAKHTFVEIEDEEGVRESTYVFTAFLGGKPIDEGKEFSITFGMEATNLEAACYLALDKARELYGKEASVRFGIWSKKPNSELIEGYVPSH